MLNIKEKAGLPSKPVATQPKHLRSAAGKIWSDASLEEWPDQDYRVFCGDLGNEVTDEVLSSAFRKYSSFQRARVIRDKRSGKGKGFGFVSFTDPHDMLAAIKDMNAKYVGNRPIKVIKSKWKEREIGSDQNKRFGEITKVLPETSKTLKKFKKIKPVTGGKKASMAPTAAAPRAFRPQHVPRPPPFGQMPKSVKPPAPVTRADI